jgi:NADPH:quinone reductase
MTDLGDSARGASGKVAGMRAWRVHSLGDPAEVMSLDEVDQPTPADGQVLVKVRAAGLNFPDVLMAMGMYQERPPLPFTPGVEICGEIVGTGQRVLGSPAGGPGGFAEYALMDAAAAFPVPDGMSDEQAASLYLTYQTGYVGLHRRAALQAGEWLLVHAGAGGVGSAAIQLGKAAGAKVIATAGGARKTDVCRDLGADHVIDYTAEDFVPLVKEITGGHGADVVYDPVGGDVFDRSRKCIAFEGRLIVVGFTSGTIPQAPVNHALVKNYSIVGLHWGLYRKHEPALFGQVHEELCRLFAQGAIAPLIGQRLPLTELPQAMAAIADRSTVGKVVLIP